MNARMHAHRYVEPVSDRIDVHTYIHAHRYVEPVSDRIEDLFNEMDNETPVMYLLSVGADPTEAIQMLAKKRKTTVECVSMGEGQDVVAKKASIHTQFTQLHPRIHASSSKSSVHPLCQHIYMHMYIYTCTYMYIISLHKYINADFTYSTYPYDSVDKDISYIHVHTPIYPKVYIQ